MENDKYINKQRTTLCSMEEILEELREKEKIEKICAENSLNVTLLKPLFILQLRGFNNTDIAQKLGIHRVTVQRYVSVLRSLKESEFEQLLKSILGGQNETGNKN